MAGEYQRTTRMPPVTPPMQRAEWSRPTETEGKCKRRWRRFWVLCCPPGAGLPDGFPTGTRRQGIQRRENLDVSTRSPGDPPHDLTLGAEGRVLRVQGPDLIQRLQQVAIVRRCQERDQLRRQLAEARAALPAAVAAERDRLEGLEVRAAQLGCECERLRRDGEGLRR